jgi:hypothetical protein
MVQIGTVEHAYLSHGIVHPPTFRTVPMDLGRVVTREMITAIRTLTSEQRMSI